jgi:hypothetical protein
MTLIVDFIDFRTIHLSVYIFLSLLPFLKVFMLWVCAVYVVTKEGKFILQK